MKKYAQMLRQAQQGLRFWTHTAMREFVVAVLNRMEARDMSRALLAESLQVSPAYVSKVLRGEANFTLESMVKIARAVGGRLSVGIVDEKSAVTASNISVSVPSAMARESSAIVSSGVFARGEQTKQLQLPQLAAPEGTRVLTLPGHASINQWLTQNVGQDDVFLLAA